MPDSSAPVRRLTALAGSVLILLTVAAPATAASGFRTRQQSMLGPGDRPDVSIKPLITVGETLTNGYVFEAIPDGISLRTRGSKVDVWINHETSLVPFPWAFTGNGTALATPTRANSQNDFKNAELSHLVLKRGTGKVLTGEYAISSADNWQRFCSNYLGTAKEGFDRPLLLTNEEATDFVNREGVAWPAPTTEPPAEQAGVVVAYDPATGENRGIYGMGRHNHENSVPIPGFGKIVLLSGDDTFTSNPAQSQVYAYVADDTDAVWNDEGRLYGFRAIDETTYNDYYDVPIDGNPAEPNTKIEGEFVLIDEADAKGTQADLEAASDELGVFQFVRIEDIAYDKRPGMSNVVYLADSGRGATSAGGNAFTSSNGRIWKMVLDPENPLHVLELSILIEGDDNPVKTLSEIHQPDNLETTATSLYLTEDPGSGQQFPANSTDPAATTARVWRYDLATGEMEVVLKVNQAADDGPTDEDLSPGVRENLGAWEASGIVDASAAFGPGAFLVDVQAHTLWVDRADGPDQFGAPGVAAPDGQPDWSYKREGGQLLLVRIPGG